MKTAVFAAALLLPVTAQAACPTVADLDKGIRFELSNGEWEEFRRLNDTVIDARYYFDATDGIRTLLSQGLYVIEVTDFDSSGLLTDTRATYSFPLTPGNMPDAIPGTTWATRAAGYASGGGLETEDQVYEFGTSRTHTIGACSFEMIPITIRYPVAGEDVTTVDTVHYLSDLGISYLAASVSAEWDDTYTYINVHVLQ